MANKTIVEVTEVLVEPPLRDGSRACVTRLGLFSTFENAATFTTQRMTERSGESGGILYYVLDMMFLDTVDQTAPTAIFGGEDKLRGMIPGDTEKPWDGREPASCKFKPGDLVGFIDCEQYRIGVIFARPPSPEDARRLSGITLGDDLYLVGLVKPNDPFDPDCFDHDHVPQPLLFEAPAQVPEELREALRHRCLGHKGFPPWTEEATLAKRDPDAVILRVLARFQHQDKSEKSGGTRATLVLDTGVTFLQAALKEANFQVVVPDDLLDYELRKRLLPHRMIVTRNTPGFLDLAPVLDYGIVGLDALPRLHGEIEYTENPTAQMVSKAIAEFGLASERGGWVIMLHPAGKHVFRRIE